MKLFMTGLLLVSSNLTSAFTSGTPLYIDHPIATDSTSLPVSISNEFGARISQIRQPETITGSSSNSFSTKTHSASSSTETPNEIISGHKSINRNENENLGFSKKTNEDEETSILDNSLGEFFSQQVSTNAAQRSMNDIVERMKMSTLHRAMQSIKTEGQEAEMSSNEEQLQQDKNDDENDDQFVMQELLDDNRRRDGKNSLINGQGDIQIAVKSRRKYEMMPVHFDRQNEQTPRMIEIVSDTMPLRLHFRSKSSAIVVSQSHDSTPMKQIAEKITMDEPYRLAHEVHKPIIQEVREFIQPYRNVIQTLRPVIEDIRTVVPKDNDVTHQHKYRRPQTDINESEKTFYSRREIGNNKNDSGSKSHRNLQNSEIKQTLKHGKDEQITIPTVNYPSWSHFKPILRSPPLRSSSYKLNKLQANHFQSPARQLSKRAFTQKSDENLHFEASEPEYVYALLTKGNENDSKSVKKYEKKNESRKIEQAIESNFIQTESKSKTNDGEHLARIDSLSNRQHDKNAEDDVVRTSKPVVNSVKEGINNRSESIDRSLSVNIVSKLNNRDLNLKTEAFPLKPEMLNLPLLHFQSNDAPFQPFIVDRINFRTALGRIERHHHHVHHQHHHHHLHHRIHHRLPFSI